MLLCVTHAGQGQDQRQPRSGVHFVMRHFVKCAVNFTKQ